MNRMMFFVMFLFFANINVDAASLCTYKEESELNSKASNIKATYEIVEDKIETDEVIDVTTSVKVSITNVSEDFYIIVEDSYLKDNITYTNADSTDGIVTFNWTNLIEVTNFKIEIYTSSNTNCPNEKIKTIYLTTPRYNEYSGREICEGQEEFYLCQKYVTFGEIGHVKFIEQVNKYINEEIDDNGEIKEEPIAESFVDKVLNYIKENKFKVLLGSILFGGVITIIVVLIYRIKTKKQRELGL